MDLTKTALSATLHCLTGCAIGEVLGMVIGTAWGWGNWPTVALSVLLAFVFGFSLTMRPLVRHGMGWRQAMRLAVASDAASISVMEIADNAVMLVIPGAISAGLGDPKFWLSLAFSLFVAFWAAFPLNRYLISRGRGHAVVHSHH